MANADAWNSGWAMGANAAAHNRERKEQLSDQERQSKLQLHATELAGLRDKLSTHEKGSADYMDTFNAMQSTLGEIRELLHPDKAPGALHRFGHIVTDALKITDPEHRIKAEAQKRADASMGDEKQAKMLAASAPISPKETAIQNADAQSAGSLEAVRSGQRAYLELFPDSTPDERTANLNSLVQQHFGVTGRGSWQPLHGKMNGEETTLLFDKNTGRFTYQNGQPVPPEFLDSSHWTPDAAKQTAFTVNHEQYLEAVQNGYKGSELQWSAEQRAKGSQSSKPESFDKQYQAILVKKMSGQTLTPDEQAHEAAWKIWNQEKNIAPGVARANAGANRYIMVYDPNDPNKAVVPMKAADAAKSGYQSPQSISFQTDKAITRYMTAGPGGANISFFNTATDHLKILQQAGMALNNGEMTLFNSLANRYNAATGDPAPTNFESVKAAVAGELSKTFKGTGATDPEIAQISATINQAESPEQILGAITYYTALMGSKLHALKIQYNNARSGDPFGNGGAAPKNPANPATPTAKPKGATHKVEHPPNSGNWFYTDNAGNNLGPVPKGQ